ncbi:MAG: hypothetical protein KKB20_05020 [Proteobacteria bacterium]|nr:hypothetical protein [Pseudomonadota bacterium]
MALQVILIFLFQNRHGVVYERIGLLSALFMAGLALAFLKLVNAAVVIKVSGEQ